MALASQGRGSDNTELSQEIQTRSLQERVAIVTGSSRGIGRDIALHLSSLGSRVVVNYTSNSAPAESTVAQVNSSSPGGSNPRAIVVRADVSDPTQVKSLFDEAEKAFNSPVNILVNSAAVIDSKYSSVPNTSLEDFDYIFRVNARGAFLCCKEAANRLKRGGGGRVIMLSTSLVGSTMPGYGAYASSKAAVETMVKILAKELKGTGITANCIAPGAVATDMFFTGKSEKQVKAAIEMCPLGRLGETKDIAPVVGFLAGDAGEWINGQVIRVNGGYV